MYLRLATGGSCRSYRGLLPVTVTGSVQCSELDALQSELAEKFPPKTFGWKIRLNSLQEASALNIRQFLHPLCVLLVNVRRLFICLQSFPNNFRCDAERER